MFALSCFLQLLQNRLENVSLLLKHFVKVYAYYADIYVVHDKYDITNNIFKVIITCECQPIWRVPIEKEWR